MAEQQPPINAYIIGRDSVSIEKADQTSTDAPNDAGYAGAFRVDVIEPPYDPAYLAKLYEHANSLRQNIDAYKTNIDGFGHEFEPVIQLREAGARELVADAIYLERSQNAQAGEDGALRLMLPPDDAEIDAKIEKIKYAMRIEKARVESFFDNCVAEESFVSLRRKTREDLEATGNGYWEVIRNDAGTVSQFAYMPSRSIRVTKYKSPVVNVQQQVRVGALAFRTESYRRRFRRYVQIGGETPVYFKEYGDPTVVSGSSGKDYPSADALLLAEGEQSFAANEVLHFKIHSIKQGAYGVPRWIGNLLSVLGSRSAEEVNFAYFDNKSIPPMAILVSGGRLGEESVKRIEDFVEVQIKGKKNFHKILVIEAETAASSIGLGDSSGALRIEIKQLTDAQLKDGLFLAYDASNMDKVGMGFRLPRLLRGDIRDFNRASAQAALDFAESQVFVPERSDFDFMVNRFILPTLGIRHWRFKSLGPRLSDSQDWGDMICKLTNAGILTPADGREIAGKKVLTHELPLVNADWVNQPLALTIAGVQADSSMDGMIPSRDQVMPSADPANLRTDGGIGTQPPQSLLMAAKSRMMRKAKELLDLRDAFRAQEAREAVRQFQQEQIQDGEVVFKMTPDEIEERFGIKRVGTTNA